MATSSAKFTASASNVSIATSLSVTLADYFEAITLRSFKSYRTTIIVSFLFPKTLRLVPHMIRP